MIKVNIVNIKKKLTVSNAYTWFLCTKIWLVIMSGTFIRYFEPIIKTKMTSTNLIFSMNKDKVRRKRRKEWWQKIGYYFRSTKFSFDNFIIQCVYIPWKCGLYITYQSLLGCLKYITTVRIVSTFDRYLLISNTLYNLEYQIVGEYNIFILL